MNSDDDVRQKTGSTHGMTDATGPLVAIVAAGLSGAVVGLAVSGVVG